MIEFIRYLICSALALGADFGLYALSLRIGLPYPVAACIGFSAGLAIAYFLSVRWAFKVRAFQDARLEFVIFAAVGVAGLLLTEGLLWVQIDLLGLNRLLAKIFASGFVFLFNFGVRKTLLFSLASLPSRTIA